MSDTRARFGLIDAFDIARGEGRREERAAVVAFIKKAHQRLSNNNVPADIASVLVLELIYERIEAGEHDKGEG